MVVSPFDMRYRITTIRIHVNATVRLGLSYYSAQIWSVIIYLLGLGNVGFVHLDICVAAAHPFKETELTKGPVLPHTQKMKFSADLPSTQCSCSFAGLQLTTDHRKLWGQAHTKPRISSCCW